MSTSPADFKQVLTIASEKVKAAAPLATDDLVRISSHAAVAVQELTGGAAALELVPVGTGDDQPAAFQLQLRKVGSEAPPSDLGVYAVAPTGYPVRRWYSRGNWEERPDDPDQEYAATRALEQNFEWMLSEPESRLVALVAFFRQSGLEPAAP